MTGEEKKRLRRGLTTEDSALWDYVTHDVEPVRGKAFVAEVDVPLDQERISALPVKQGVRPHKPSAKSAPPAMPSPPLAPPKPAIGMEPLKQVELERRKARRIVRGAQEVEARLDLHGMTQDEAHGTLSGFIRRCAAAGMRTVIVITGKGGQRRREDDDTDTYSARPRGVLRRNVPLWLAEPGLRPFVVSYSRAHAQHGGDGAIYVMLRRA